MVVFSNNVSLTNSDIDNDGSFCDDNTSYINTNSDIDSWCDSDNSDVYSNHDGSYNSDIDHRSTFSGTRRSSIK